MRVRLAGFVLAVLVLGASGAQAASRPPRGLHQAADGHWTAWNAPQPEAGANVYVIVKGDTLWDLAKRYYGNPYLWPQLWEKNQYIKDAHWIYPGDPLDTGVQVAPAPSLGQTGGGSGSSAGGGAPGETVVPAPSVPGVESAVKTLGAPPVPLGAESDIYCTGYVADPDEKFSYTIAGSEYDNLQAKLHPGYHQLQELTAPGTSKINLTPGDIVYLTGGNLAGLIPGAVFTIVGPDEPVIHPITGQQYGRFYPYEGRLRVLSVQDTSAIAEITHGCEQIHLGDRLKPFEAEPVPLGRPTPQRPVNLPVSAAKLQDDPVIIFSRNVISLGQDHVVFMDRGSDQNVTPGDTFTIYRPSERGLPPLPIGEVAVLSVQRHSAAVKITESRYPVYLGDRLDPK
jgi:hypothetical protein